MSAAWLALVVSVDVVLLGATWRLLKATVRDEETALQASFRRRVEETLYPRLEQLIDTIQRVRRPEQETEAGVVPAESTHDALARQAAWNDLNDLVKGAQHAAVARSRKQTHVTCQRLLGLSLIFMAAMVVLVARTKVFKVHTSHDYDVIVWTLGAVSLVATGALVIVTLVAHFRAERFLDNPVVDLEQR